jgi:hypothetical protein
MQINRIWQARAIMPWKTGFLGLAKGEKYYNHKQTILSID